jgi:hypothetical protein
LTIRERVEARRRDHRFALSRAGTWSRNKAVGQRTEFLRRSWRRLALLAAVGLAITPFVLLMPPWIRQFAAGAWVASVGWYVWYLATTLSGSVPADLGALGEQWTAGELRSLRRQGWRVMSHLTLRHADIDHVAIGPGGVLVVETKWRSDKDAFGQNLESLPVSRLLGSADDVRLMLQARLNGAAVKSVFVIWGPRSWRSDLADEAPPGVVVLAGRDLSRWLKSLPSEGLGPDQVADAWSTLEAQVQKRDARDRAVNGPAQRGVQMQLVSLMKLIGFAMVGLCAALLAMRWVPIPWYFLAVLALAGVAYVVARVKALTSFALAALTGVVLFQLMFAGAEIFQLVGKR